MPLLYYKRKLIENLRDRKLDATKKSFKYRIEGKNLVDPIDAFLR